MCVAVLVGPDEACGCSMTEHTPWYCLCLAYHTSEQVPSLLTYLPVISNLVWPYNVWAAYGVNTPRTEEGNCEVCGCSMTEHIPWHCLYLACQTSEQVPTLLKYLPVISRTCMVKPYFVWGKSRQ